MLIPAFTALLYLLDAQIYLQTANWTVAFIFAVAVATDQFSNFLARLWKQTSDFGAFLDLVADKLIVTVALLLLVDTEHTNIILTIIIIGREITTSALREWMAQMNKHNSVAVATIGKFKTTARMLAILPPLTEMRDFYGFNLILISNILMLIVPVSAIRPMFYYLGIAWKELEQSFAKK